MDRRAVGGSGLRVSTIGLGTADWGTVIDGDSAAAQLAAFVDAGGTLVDTAAHYGQGRAQRTLAELIDDVVPRDRLVISAAAGWRPAPGAAADNSRAALLSGLDATLAELGTDHVDLWSVAGPDPTISDEEVASALEIAVRSGRARYAGVRDHTGWQLATAVGNAESVAGRPVAAQARYSLLDRRAEAELLPAADHHRVGILAVSPLAAGVLTGKYRKGIPADSRGADPAAGLSVQPYLTRFGSNIVEAVMTAADGLGTSPLAVALAWVRDRPGVGSVIVGPRDIGQLTGILAAVDVALPAAITAALDDVSR